MSIEVEGFGALRGAIINQVIETTDDVFDQMEGTDTEKLIYSAMVLFAKVSQREHVNLQFLKSKVLPPEELSATTTLFVTRQKSLDSSAFDFAVHAYDHRPTVLKAPGWRRLIVECDMSDEAYPIVTADDRRALHQRVMYLSKRNITSSSWECAASIFDWASWTFGY